MTGLDAAEKERIAGRARTLQERLDAAAAGSRADAAGTGGRGPNADAGAQADAATGGQVEADAAPDAAAGTGTRADAAAWVEQWCEYVADDDPERFAARLDRAGLSREECERRLAADPRPSADRLPGWVEELDDLVAYVRTYESDPGVPDRGDDVAFFDVVEPFVSYARSGVDDAVGEVLSDAAVRDLAGWLAARLSAIFSHTLFVEFKKFTHGEQGAAEQTAGDEPSTRQYDRFVEHTLDEVADLFVKYSFLGRLAATSIRQWTAFVEEVAARLADDWSEIERLFPAAGPAEAVVAVDVLGDPHVGARRVLKLEFDAGFAVAYKPRNSGIAAWFNDLLSWVNEHGDLPDLRTVGVVPRPEYAWMEWVDPEECATGTEVADYYRRAGMLVCLFYATDVVDMHLENVVAEGDQPVVVDLETLAHPEIDPGYLVTDWDHHSRESVLRTGAVPLPDAPEEGTEISCFATATVEFSSGFHGFENVNTDSMALEERPEVSVVGDNLPVHDGDVTDPGDHVGAILDGFEEMYEFVLDNRERILAEGGPVGRLGDRAARVSVIYRNSRNYSAVRKLATHQPNLRTGLQFGTKVEALAKPMLSGDVRAEAWTVYRRERAVLRNWNCPRFTADVRDRAVYCRGDELVSEFFERSPGEQVRRRIRGFDRDDLEAQADLVRRGFGG